MNKSNFEMLGLSKMTLNAIQSKGFEEPTEIQTKIIPAILNTNSDLIGIAQTGTGKTAAFALPLIDILNENEKEIQALVLVPTRELAIQVSDEINSLRGSKNINSAPIYGGQSFETQLRRLRKGVDIIVGTPGRIIDHLNRGTINFESVSFVILDEADEMLNMGFIEDIENILEQTKKDKRTLLFSATMPDRILKLTKKYMKKSELIKTKNSGTTIDSTDQKYFEVRESDKFESLCRIIDTTSEFYGIVFCRTKTDVDYVSTKLIDRGYDAEGIHGDISQNIREKILRNFRSKKINILIATDVAARGLDIYDMTHVINYSLPQDPESYLHRIGRTGRAGKEGTAITFISPDEYRKLNFIKSITKTNIRKARIPKVDEVINFKKTKIINEINSLVEYGVGTNYLMLAKDLLIDNDPLMIISALLKYNFQDTLEEEKYAKVHDLFEKQKNAFEETSFGKRRHEKRSRDNYSEGRSRNSRREDDGRKRNPRREDEGKIRLFCALGKKDDFDLQSFLGYISKKTGIPKEKISGTQLSDAFSFFNVYPEDLDKVMKKLNGKKADRPLVEIAKK
ncbi:MAG: DEAD/DEAH box helicase [Ignavibacteriales bacterium]